MTFKRKHVGENMMVTYIILAILFIADIIASAYAKNWNALLGWICAIILLIKIIDNEVKNK
jgi:hypothetical protein